MVAAASLKFHIQNISDDVYTFPEEEAVAHQDNNETDRSAEAAAVTSNKNATSPPPPSVLELLLEANPHEQGHGAD